MFTLLFAINIFLEEATILSAALNKSMSTDTTATQVLLILALYSTLYQYSS